MEFSERQKKIIDLLSERSMSIMELADRLFASEMTIRRDVAQLKKMGVVNQFRGGVSIKKSRSFQSFDFRADIEKAEKVDLAKRAAELVTDGMLIYIDNSTTCYYIVQFLGKHRDISVVTNSEPVMHDLGKMGIKVKMASGNYIHRDRCVVGSETEEYIKNYRYDLAFLSSSGYDDVRITSWSEAQTNVRRAVIESAAKTYILMTPMKWKRRSYFVTCRTENVELITTEQTEKNNG